jgi:CRP-like cAMP-binding protein
MLEQIGRAGHGALSEGCAEMELVFAATLAMPGDELTHAIFPTHGYISLISKVKGGEVEVGMIGNEGMLGFSAMLGVTATNVKVIVQGAGRALRIPMGAFVKQLQASSILRTQIGGYGHYINSGYVQSAGCNRYHTLPARLARWLLMTADRAQSCDFRMTHQFMATMLGVRRVGVTTAASELQEGGLIEYSRGNVRILDRDRLEKRACNCYQMDHEAYALMDARR